MLKRSSSASQVGGWLAGRRHQHQQQRQQRTVLCLSCMVGEQRPGGFVSIMCCCAVGGQVGKEGTVLVGRVAPAGCRRHQPAWRTGSTGSTLLSHPKPSVGSPCCLCSF